MRVSRPFGLPVPEYLPVLRLHSLIELDGKTVSVDFFA